MKQELAIRRYGLGGGLIRVDKHKGMTFPKIQAYIYALLKMAKVFGHDRIAPVNPCNISVRGPNGKFVKWKK